MRFAIKATRASSFFSLIASGLMMLSGFTKNVIAVELAGIFLLIFAGINCELVLSQPKVEQDVSK